MLFNSKFDQIYYSYVIEEGKRRKNRETFSEIINRTKKEASENTNQTPVNIFDLKNSIELRTDFFNKDYQSLDVNHKQWVDDWFEKWRSGTFQPRFEFKGHNEANSIRNSVKALGINKNRINLYAVTVSEREPAIRMLVSKLGNNIVWLRIFTSYDEYQTKLSLYKYTRSA
jgi:hypothetical protein